MKLYQEKKDIINNFIETQLYQTIKNQKMLEISRHAFSDGKRLRSILGYIISNKIQSQQGYSLDLSKSIVFIEMLHNISLIVDDLPCMDNDKYRRGKETVHYKYGITSAQILSSYLLGKSFQLLNSNIKEIKKANVIDSELLENNVIEIYKHINKNLGIMGAASGQFIDTCPMNPFLQKKDYIAKYSSKSELEKLIYLKTTTFYEIAFVTSYLLSGGDVKNLETLKTAVKYFGLFFQLSDDFEDVEQDSMRDLEFNPNFVVKFGYHKAEELFYEAIEKFKKKMKILNIYDPVFDEIIQYLIVKVDTHKNNNV